MFCANRKISLQPRSETRPTQNEEVDRMADKTDCGSASQQVMQAFPLRPFVQPSLPIFAMQRSHSAALWSHTNTDFRLLNMYSESPLLRNTACTGISYDFLSASAKVATKTALCHTTES